MPKDNQGKRSFAKGFRPLNEGYTPKEQRSFSANSLGNGLPKAPKGGTGASAKTIATASSTKPRQ